MKQLSRLFENLDDAGAATAALVDAGVDRASIGLIAPATSQSLGFDSMDEMSVRDDPDRIAGIAAMGAIAGAAVGSTIGLLMGMGLLVIPGVGPAMAIGPLYAALTVAGLGGIAGAIGGMIAGAGVPPLDSNEYSRAVRPGTTLLLIAVEDERAAEAERVLSRFDSIPLTRQRTRTRPRRL